MELYNVLHVGSLAAFDSETGVNSFTKEIQGQVWTDRARILEPFMFKNSMIVDGTMNSTGIKPTNANGELAGTYVGAVKQKEDSTEDFKMMETLGDIKFAQYSSNRVQLEIRNFIKTKTETINMTTDAKWLTSGIISAIVNVAQNDIINRINYEVYAQFAPAAHLHIDHTKGQGAFFKNLMFVDQNGDHTNVGADNAWGSTTRFSELLLNEMARFEAMPDDLYVVGFDSNEQILILDPEARAKLLVSKLQIIDGSTITSTGATAQLGIWYQGLPYTGIFNGRIMLSSKYLIAPNNGRYGATLGKTRAILTTIGRFSPLFFELCNLEFFAEKIPFAGNSLGVYGQALYGTKIEPKFAQYMTVFVTNPVEIAKNFAMGIKEVAITGVGVDTLNFKAESEGADFTGYTYNIFKRNDKTPLNTTPIALLEANAIATGTLLDSRTEYRLIINGPAGSAEREDRDGNFVPVPFQIIKFFSTK